MYYLFSFNITLILHHGKLKTQLKVVSSLCFTLKMYSFLKVDLLHFSKGVPTHFILLIRTPPSFPACFLNQTRAETLQESHWCRSSVSRLSSSGSFTIILFMKLKYPEESVHLWSRLLILWYPSS